MSYQYEFSILAIFRNEAMLLKQWLDHHILFGCDHFYLIDNNSDDGFSDILRPYIASGLVDLVEDTGNYRQPMAYNEHYLDMIRRETRWIGIIDVDEFLYPRQGLDTIGDVLEGYGGSAGLAVPWLTFGSNGHISQPDDIVESFTMRQDYNCQGWTSFKTVARTSDLAEIVSAEPLLREDCILGTHSCLFRPEKQLTPAFLPRSSELLGTPRPYCYYFRECNIGVADLVINHYRVLSVEYYKRIKTRRPSAAIPAYDLEPDDMTYFNSYDFNEKEDTVLRDITRSKKTASHRG